MTGLAETLRGQSLFERAGGFDALDQAVPALLQRIAADPMVATLLPAGAGEDLRWQVQFLLTDLLGGPIAYDGPEPGALRTARQISEAQAGRLLAHAIDSLAATGVAGGLLDDCRTALLALLARAGFHLEAPRPAEPALPPAGPREVLVAQALLQQARAGLADWNLFVLDRECTVVYQSPEAAEALAAVDGELFRVFGIRATEVVGHPVGRFHPAPARFTRLLQELGDAPLEATWAFGQVTWRTQLVRVMSGGYLVAWRDDSAARRTALVLERLRQQAEELPLPVMFPGEDPALWGGNAACAATLERLAPHLPMRVNPLEGVPVALFLPDPDFRVALFGSPARLPHSGEVWFGPERVTYRVLAVRDSEQRYLGPQLTWEVTTPRAAEPAAPVPLHVEPPVQVQGAPAPAAAPVPASRPAPAPAASPASASARASAGDSRPAAASGRGGALRAEARALATASEDLLRLTRHLEHVADAMDGLSLDGVPAGEPQAVVAQGEESARLAQAALAALAELRAQGTGGASRPEVTEAVTRLTGLARETNRLAVEAALFAVEDEAAVEARRLAGDARALAEGLGERVKALAERAEAGSRVVAQGQATAARLAELRDAFAAAPLGPHDRLG